MKVKGPTNNPVPLATNPTPQLDDVGQKIVTGVVRTIFVTRALLSNTAVLAVASVPRAVPVKSANAKDIAPQVRGPVTPRETAVMGQALVVRDLTRPRLHAETNAKVQMMAPAAFAQKTHAMAAAQQTKNATAVKPTRFADPSVVHVKTVSPKVTVGPAMFPQERAKIIASQVVTESVPGKTTVAANPAPRLKRSAMGAAVRTAISAEKGQPIASAEATGRTAATA